MRFTFTMNAVAAFGIKISLLWATSVRMYESASKVNAEVVGVAIGDVSELSCDFAFEINGVFAPEVRVEIFPLVTFIAFGSHAVISICRFIKTLKILSTVIWKNKKSNICAISIARIAGRGRRPLYTGMEVWIEVLRGSAAEETLAFGLVIIAGEIRAVVVHVGMQNAVQGIRTLTVHALLEAARQATVRRVSELQAVLVGLAHSV